MLALPLFSKVQDDPEDVFRMGGVRFSKAGRNSSDTCGATVPVPKNSPGAIPQYSLI